MTIFSLISRAIFMLFMLYTLINTYLRFPTDRVFVELSLLHCIVSEGLEYCDPLVTINIFSIKEASLYISVSAEKQ